MNDGLEGKNTEEIEELIKSIYKDSPYSALLANELVEIGAPAVFPLVKALTLYTPRYNTALYHDDQAYKFCRSALLGIGREAIKPLILIFELRDEFQSGTASYFLKELANHQTIDLFVDALSHPDKDVRKFAGEVLAKIFDEDVLARFIDPRAPDALISILTNNDVEVIETAIIALGNLRNSRAFLPLARLLRNPGWYQNARLALEKIG